MLSRISSIAAGRRSKWIVLGVWVIAAVAVSSLQPKLQDSAVDEPEQYLPLGADSVKALNTLEDRFPEGRDVSAVVVFHRDGGLTRADGRRIISYGRELSQPKVLFDAQPAQVPFDSSGRVDPRAIREGLVSKNRATAVVIIPMSPEDDEPLKKNVDRIRDSVGAGVDSGRRGGLEAHVTGPAGLSVDAIEVFNSIDVQLLLATVTLVLILLLLVYRSPLTALVPLITVGVAYTIAAAIVYAVVKSTGLDINSQTTSILIVLMFGAGTDYCLLIASRFREELRETADKHDAMAAATRRTAPAILSAGGTVFAAMLVLGLADLKSTQTMGPVLAIGILVMLAAGLTLLPALLAILGRNSFWPAIPRVGIESRKPIGVWRRVGHLVHDRPAVTMVAVIAVLGVGALGNLVDTKSLSFGQGFRETTDSELGQNRLAESLPAGEVGVGNVIVATSSAPKVERTLSSVPSVAAVRVQSQSNDRRLTRINVVFTADPFADSVIDLTPRIRNAVESVPGSAPALYGGPSAESYDTNETLASDARLLVPAVLILILLILMALLRAVVAPIYLVLTVVLSFAFALGVSTVLFTQVIDAPGVEPSLPTFAFIFLVALGVDYNIFLISRVREESDRLGIRDGVISALERTGGVITSAGLILVGTFLVLAVLPLWSLTEIGLTVAIGLLVDTFVVRTLLVPSIAFLLGDLNWWPSNRGRRRSG